MHSGELIGFPFRAALFEDAGEELLTGLVAAAFLASDFGLGRDEAPFAGRLEHRRPIALQFGLRPTERCYCRIQPCKLLLNFRDDAFLLSERRYWDLDPAKLLREILFLVVPPCRTAMDSRIAGELTVHISQR